jgi:hypothetical protein
LANKLAAVLPLLALLAVPARAELLKLSLLKKGAPAFTVKRDIFNGGVSAAGGSQPGKTQTASPAQAAVLQKTIAEEIFQSVSYEGFVIKNAKKSALLNISGEYYMVSEGDQVLDKIKILAISRRLVTIEYENLPYDIKIKGDENG